MFPDPIAALGASLAVALTSLGARIVVWLPGRCLQQLLPWLQAAAAGLLLGDALLHMLPAAIAAGIGVARTTDALALGVLGLVGAECAFRTVGHVDDSRTLARMDRLGDGLHHLVDGLVIGTGFALDATLGWVIALAIACHELPREIGNAAVLVAGGLPPRKAFGWSVATTAAIPLGTLLVLLAARTPLLIGTGLAVAAGTTLYLACGAILPALWRNLSARQRFAPFVGVAGGLTFMWLAAMFEHAH